MLNRHAAAEDALIVVWNFKNGNPAMEQGDCPTAKPVPLPSGTRD